MHMWIYFAKGRAMLCSCDYSEENKQRTAYIVVEYRAIYDSEMKVFYRIKRPQEISIEDLVIWFRENICGSWKMIFDVFAIVDSKYVIDDNFSLLLSRKEDFAQYKLTW